MEVDVNVRKKRSDVSKRKNENKNLSFHIIKMKLNRFSKNEKFKNLLIKNVANMNKIKSYAYHLINFHTLRCLDNGLELPDYNNQNFYYKCMAYVSRFQNRKETIDSNNELVKSIMLFMNNIIEPPTKNYCGNLINNASIEMKTVVINHMVLNFPNRLKRYCLLKYGIKDIWHLVNNLFEGIVHYVPNKAEQEIKDFIYISPKEDNIKQNLHHFLKLEYQIQKYFDTLELNTKGLRNFSITPTKGSFVHSYMKICSSCLGDILKSSNDSELKKLGWRDLFNINAIETCNKSFHNEILTDGYGVSITLEKSLNIDIFEVDECNKITCSCGYKISKSGYKKHLDSQTHIRKIRTKKTIDDDCEEYERYVGIDPGINQIFTGVDDNNLFINCSSNEYRTKSKIIDNLEWNKRQIKENPTIQTIINNLKSFKTVDINNYKEAFDTYNNNYNTMVEFYNNKPYKKWKFKTYCFSKKTISQMCKTICKDKKTLVGYGDWSKNQGIIKKHPSTPNKKLREALARYKNCKVISVNEYRTSKECSKCKEAVYNIKNCNKKRCHQVVRCSNNECSMCWQRDKNASRNILRKLYSENLGRNPPEWLEVIAT